ncbi:unnamed protein product [Caenorhabditis nigoni]
MEPTRTGSTALKILASSARDELLKEWGMSRQSIQSKTRMMMNRGEDGVKLGFGVSLDLSGHRSEIDTFGDYHGWTVS